MTVHRFPGASRAVPPASAVRPAPGETPEHGARWSGQWQADELARAARHLPEDWLDVPVDLTPPPARPVDHAREYLRSFRRAPVVADRFDRIMWWVVIGMVLALCGAGAVSVIVTMAQIREVLP